MNQRIIGLSIVLILIAGCGKSPNQLMDLAEDGIAKGDFPAAVSAYQQVIDLRGQDSLSAEAYYALAHVYLDRQFELKLGYQTLQGLVERFPETTKGTIAATEIQYFPDWLLSLAETKKANKDIQKAIQTLEYLVVNFPESPKAAKAQYSIGDIYMNDLRDFNQAIDNYRKVTELFFGSGQDAHAQFMIGYIYANVLNDSAQAATAYRKFLKDYPKHELVPSVSFELEYLGLDINEIPVLKHITGSNGKDGARLLPQ